MASSDMVIIVGNAMIASNKEPFKAFNTLGKSVSSAILGPTNTMPRKPMTTDGIAANISIKGFNMFLTFGLAYSEM
ncbi:hypothetical protein D3C72_1716790 [compost metagenome]